MIPLETFFWVKATNRGKPRQRAKVGGSPIWESPDGKSTPRGMFFYYGVGGTPNPHTEFRAQETILENTQEG